MITSFMNKCKRKACSFFLGAFIFAITFALVEKQMTIADTDYQIHAIKAIDIFQSGFHGFISRFTYPIWHLEVKFFERVLHFRLYEAAAISTAIVELSTFIVCLYIMKKVFSEQYKEWVLAIFSFVLLIIEPISYNQLSGTVTSGVAMINQWHNPTNLIARMFGILSFFAFIEIIKKWEKQKIITNYGLVILAIFMVLANLGKPSFGQVFLPAVMVFCICYCVILKFNPFMLCIGIAISCIPSAAVLLVQMKFPFSVDSEGMEIAWFDVISALWGNVPFAVFKLLIFPIVVMLIDIADAVKEHKIQLAWCVWLVGFLEYAAFAEIGAHRYHGNFSWGQTIGIFLLQFAALIKLLEYSKRKSKRKCMVSLAWIIFALQVVCGIVYLWWLLTVESYWY